MSATINGAPVTAMVLDGDSMQSAWMDGSMVWSAVRMEDGVSWERYFDKVTSAIPFSEYLSSRDMVTTTPDWTFQGNADRTALFIYPAAPFEGSVNFMSDMEAEPSPEWLLGFGLTEPNDIRAGANEIFYMPVNVGVADETGGMAVVLHISSVDEGVSATLGIRQRDGSMVTSSVEFPVIERDAGAGAAVGEVHLHYVHADRTIRGFADRQEKFAVEVPAGSVSLAQLPCRPAVSVPQVTTTASGGGYISETMPLMTYIAGYTGWAAHDKASQWGLTGEQFVLYDEDTVVTPPEGARWVDIVALGGGGGGSGGGAVSGAGLQGLPGKWTFTTWRSGEAPDRALTVTIGTGGAGSSSSSSAASTPGTATTVTNSEPALDLVAAGGSGVKGAGGSRSPRKPDTYRVFNETFPQPDGNFGAGGAGGQGGILNDNTGGNGYSGAVWLRFRF